jgi:hypothetical protein
MGYMPDIYCARKGEQTGIPDTGLFSFKLCWVIRLMFGLITSVSPLKANFVAKAIS